MSFYVNQGTSTLLASDNNNGTTYGIVKLDIGAIGTTFPWQGQVILQPGTNSAGSVGITALPNIPGGSIVMTNGTLASLPNLPQGSIQVTAGTVTATVGTIPGIGSVSNVGSLGVLNAGTITSVGTVPGIGTVTNIGTVGTTTGIGVVTSVTNLASGTLAILTNGTLSNSGTTTGVGSVSNIGSLAMLNAGTISTLPNLPGGSIAVTAGTMNTGTINSGTINTGTFTYTGGTLNLIGTITNIGSISNIGTMPAQTLVLNSGTITTGSITDIAMLHAGTLTTIPNIPGGTLGVVSSLTNGSIVVTNGTIGAGTVHLAGTVLDNFAGLGTFTITLGTLASSGSVGRQSTLVDNTSNLWPAALIGCQITPGTVTAVGVVNVYLIRSDNGGGPIQDDMTGASDALATVNAAPLLGVIPIGIGTNVMYKNVFDTSFLGHLGPKFGIVVQHALGNPFAAAGSQSITYQGINPKFT